MGGLVQITMLKKVDLMSRGTSPEMSNHKVLKSWIDKLASEVFANYVVRLRKKCLFVLA